MTKRDDILATALRLFVYEGIENTATARISSEAGVATGTLFHHFRNKDGLIEALYLEIKTGLRDLLMAQWDCSKGLSTLVQTMANAYVDWALEYPLHYRFLRQCSTSYQVSDSIREQIDQMFIDVHEAFSEAKASGQLRALPLDLLLDLMTASLNTFADYMMANPDARSDQSLRTDFQDSIWRTIAND